MITINKLKVTFKNNVALDINRTIEIKDGDRIGIIGSNGAGKSTLVKSILGLVKYEGEIKKTISNSDIAIHLQENNYVETIKVKGIMEAILNTKIKDNVKLQELITYFDFDNCLNNKYNKLSGGQKQRMTIIMILMQDAKLTFFDEVTSGLDFETRKTLMDKIKNWYQDKEASLALVSHYYEELEQLINKVLIIEKGQVIEFDTPQVLFKKYCGKSILILDNNTYNQSLVKDYNQILAPDHLIAISINDDTQEQIIISSLIKEHINFKSSDCDLEIMYYNAINKEKLNDEK